MLGFTAKSVCYFRTNHVAHRSERVLLMFPFVTPHLNDREARACPACTPMVSSHLPGNGIGRHTQAFGVEDLGAKITEDQHATVERAKLREQGGAEGWGRGRTGRH